MTKSSALLPSASGRGATRPAAARPGALESDVILFSSQVDRKQGHTSDLEVLRTAIKKDTGFPRAATALYDAMGEGITGLADRPAPRVLVVCTDGRENASKRFTEEQVIKLAQQHRVRIVVFATLLSDVKAIERLTAQTGGLYVFAPSVKALLPEADKVGRVLGSMRAFELLDPRVSAAVSIELAGSRP